MAHPEQQDFFKSIKNKYPEVFNDKSIIDCGSLDINGSLKQFCDGGSYLGVDITAGRGVDLVSKIHELIFADQFDTVISSEMLEHDEYWKISMLKMYSMCKSGGFIVFSAAGEGRPEHGTTRTGAHWGTSNDYYKNILEEDIRDVYQLDMFDIYEISHHAGHGDIFFFGKKK